MGMGRVNRDLQKGMRMDLRYITTQTMIQNAKEDNK